DPLINKSGRCDPTKNSNYQCLSPYQGTSGSSTDGSYTANTVIDKYGSDPGSFGSGTANITYNFGPGGYKIGIYYNYCAASLGSYCYGSGTSAGSSATGNATEADICPFGWRLPTGGSGGEYQNLYNKINLITVAQADATNLLSLQAMLSTPISGLYNGSTAWRQGVHGSLWASTYYNTSYNHYATPSGTTFDVITANARFWGASVRCIAQN
ncbi:hypothetical protein IJI18_00280, partial [Candidatus Saccharibacteria bacterium]|nr:hypothetical protein [Candidatus Saccharibacteria bacterium]